MEKKEARPGCVMLIRDDKFHSVNLEKTGTETVQVDGMSSLRGLDR